MNFIEIMEDSNCALYRLNDNGEYKRNLTKAKYYIEKELEWLEKCHQE